MTDTIREFCSFIDETAQDFLAKNYDEVVIFHHNDADGLSSGVITIRALERLGIKVRSFCLEKPYPGLLKYIVHTFETTAPAFFVDFDKELPRDFRLGHPWKRR